MGSQFVIYGLFDPRTDELRYVGKSCSGLDRPRAHSMPSILSRDGRTHKSNWIKSLLSLGLKPEIVVLEEFPNSSALNAMEIQAIEHYKAMGFQLVNGTKGGDGGPGGKVGHSMTEESKRKLSVSLKARPPEVGFRISRSQGGRPFRDLDSGTVYQSIYAVAKELNLNTGNVSSVLHGRMRQTKGHRFQYLPEKLHFQYSGKLDQDSSPEGR